MAERKAVYWSNEEVGTFLSLVTEDKIQRKLDGATRNESFPRGLLVSAMKEHFSNVEMTKKMKSDYRSTKNHNGRSRSNRKNWRWFD